MTTALGFTHDATQLSLQPKHIPSDVAMLIKDLFVSDVTRDIPPVVYFHDHSPEKLKDEVSEYIITGGWPASHPHHKRVPSGIHEQYVRLLVGHHLGARKTRWT